MVVFLNKIVSGKALNNLKFRLVDPSRVFLVYIFEIFVFGRLKNISKQ